MKLLATSLALTLPMGMVAAQSPAPTQPSTPRAEPSEASPKAGVEASPVTDAELAKGATVNDPSGTPVGKIEALNAEGVVLTVGALHIQVPRNAIGKNERGLVITVTRSQLEARAKESAS